MSIADLELRLNELEQPEAQGAAISSRDFLKLTALTVVLPIVMIIIGWMALP
ncbi:hypothetical protein [Agrococcus sp. Ld7]|uniref:hypothetical protein n=1 Tax=Agrococcus sp. Ld7 TaxID=649148 RepID=UPI00386CA451